MRALRGLGFESVELMPVLRRGQAVALLTLLSTASAAFGDAERVYARGLAAIVGLAIAYGHHQGVLQPPPAAPPLLPGQGATGLPTA